MTPPPVKSATAFRTIGEVAEELGLPQHVLRFWETRFPQIQPLKRGGNRRYYRPADIDLLRDIARMLHSEGYTIKGVQKLLGEKPRATAPAPAPAAASSETTVQSAPADLTAIRAIRDRLANALQLARAA
jgi:DNA-binding transcriptional MerR regulator